MPVSIRINCAGMSAHTLASFLAGFDSTDSVMIGSFSVRVKTRENLHTITQRVSEKFSGFRPNDFQEIN